MILVTGGANSGKSNFAEKKAKEIGNKVLYIATSEPFDDEMINKIEMHKKRRPKHWDTFEGYTNIDDIVYKNKYKYDCILFDCITLFITNNLIKISESLSNIKDDETYILYQFKSIIKAIKETNTEIIFVTNEVGMGIVPENKLARNFREISGNINQIVAKESDEVYMVVSGIPIKIK